MQTFFSLLSAAAVSHVSAQETGQLGDAAVVSNNPVGPIYSATLPKDPFFKAGSLNGNVKGSIIATSTLSGKGVMYKIRFENLPKEGGPFPYHLHVDPVGSDGNCTKTLAHLDPYIRGEATPCDATKPATCQVGDLSGKFGAINSDPWETTYVDEYSSTLPGLGSYFGNRSFVLHFANKTRITCASFELVVGNHPPTHTDNCSTTTTTTIAGTGGVVPTVTRPPFLGAAATSSVPVTMIFLGVAALMFTL